MSYDPQTGELITDPPKLELEAAAPNPTGYDPVTGAANPEAPEDAPYYCPGCGARYEYRQKCLGMSAEHPHPPIEVVSTDELKGDPSGFTPAPASE